MKDIGRVIVLGAGPTGLGAAYRLEEAGYRDFEVLEARAAPGGLATSYVDEHGFVWDVGGHVQFSHYSYYDEVLDRALGDAWLWHERESWIWMRRRFIPYPFQYNVGRLDGEDRRRALDGLETAARASASAPEAPRHFEDWVLRTFGEGIAELFMFPYNRKVWGYPLDQLDAGWVGERVAVPDLDRVRANIARGRDDVSWGPNRRFRFPERGGTGAIWQGVAALLDPERLRYRCPVTEIDVAGRTLRLADGGALAFDHLVTSIPLDRLCALCTGLAPDLSAAARRLRYSSCHILGIGLAGERPRELATKCWMYFPEAHSPYYRVTVFSNYSPHNVPEGVAHWSLMAEVCESPAKPVDASRLRDDTLAALVRDGLVDDAAAVVSFWHHREEHGYPTPFLGRDEVLGPLVAGLERHRIYSRGRFGAWKYEVSNQDHSFMQGVELVDRLLGSGEEVTLLDPARANSGAFLRDRPSGEG